MAFFHDNETRLKTQCFMWGWQKAFMPRAPTERLLCSEVVGWGSRLLTLTQATGATSML